MLLCELFLRDFFHIAKISSSKRSYLYIQKLWLNNTKMFYSCYQLNYDVSRLFSSKDKRTYVVQRKCHSFIQNLDIGKTSDDEQKILATETFLNKPREENSDEKIKIYFETTKGERIECFACINQNVMNASIENDIAMHGNCNGEAICSVCHVYVDKKFQEFMPKISDEESEMLDMVPNFEENSRLSCQIIVRKELEGAVFKLPPYDGPSFENPNNS